MDHTSQSADPVVFEIPEVFRHAVPRPIPESVSQGRLATMRRKMLFGCLVAGTICIGLSPLPFMETLALYVLPLGWLLWIGAGIVVIGFLGWLRAVNLKKACRYIEEGSADLGTVLELAKTPVAVHNGQPTHYAIAARVVVENPVTLEQEVCDVRSAPFSADKRNQTDTRFRVGDQVAVVWMPDEFPASAQIFDFLEVTPEDGLVRYADETRLWEIMLAAALVPLIFFALFWNIYAFGRYQPIDFDFVRLGGLPMAVGGGIGLVILLAAWLKSRRAKAEVLAANQRAAAEGAAVELAVNQGLFGKALLTAAITFGAALLCGLTVLCWCWTANALLDESPAARRPVIVTEMTQTTHAMIFREYNLEYKLVGENGIAGDGADASGMKLLTTPQHMSEFVVPVGTAVIREGRLGWPWVETIEPIGAVEAGQ